QDDIVFFPLINEGGYPAFTHHGRQRLAYGLYRHAKIGSAGLVDADTERGQRFLVIGLYLHEQATGFGAFYQQVTPLRELLVGTPSQHELHGLATTATRQARTHEHVVLYAGNLLPLGIER